MTDQPFDDPQLVFIESQLAAVSLKVAPETEQRYLYECGVAAGKRASRPALRRWKVAAATLAVAIIAIAVPHGSHQPSLASPANALQARTPVAVDLDAWQLPAAERAAAVDDVAQLTQNDPNLRSRTVAALLQRVLEH